MTAVVADTGDIEAIRRFAINVQSTHGGPMVTLHEGRNVGHKAICRVPTVAARKVVQAIPVADEPHGVAVDPTGRP